MKFFVLSMLALTMTSVVFASDSFEIVKGGTTYSCVAKEAPISGDVRQLCRFAQTGNGQTIYYPNGRVFTHSAGNTGATWYYDNGNVMTHGAGSRGSTWYYNNGKVLTHSAGSVGATWYYSNGRVISHSMGSAGATIYYESGEVMTHSGPAMNEDELLYPCDYIK
ncbi:hypothetical protein [Bdellovibrio sp. HCB337]|uniref:hypothetical protein n=1 Tax=Bdellovibrio sp. HCB337 TaxID=3394358 RepID=UPI0039A7243A